LKRPVQSDSPWSALASGGQWWCHGGAKDFVVLVTGSSLPAPESSGDGFA